MPKSRAAKSPSQFKNPMLAVDEEDDVSEIDDIDSELFGGDMSAAKMIEANASEMTEEELADLTYAFRKLAYRH